MKKHLLILYFVGILVITALACACSGGGGSQASMDAGDGGSDAGGDGAGGDVSIGTCSALTPITPVIEPGNGPERLGDADTDGNGILDRDEWGPIRESPLDYDYDGIADYEDADDDGDGLLDLYDAERLLASPEADWREPDRLWLASTRVDTEGAAAGAARIGDTLVVIGDGLGCSNIVSFLGAADPINLAPLSVEGDELRVVVPAGAQGPIAVYRAEDHSNLLPLQVAAESSPFLFEAEEPAREGATFVLHGSGLSGVTLVELHGASLTPASVSDSEVSIVVPTGLPGPGVDAVVFRGGTESNAVPVQVVREIRVNVRQENTADLEVVSATSRKPLDTAHGADIEVRARGVGLVSVLSGPVALLEAVVLPTDTVIELSPTSSATAAAMLATQVWRVVAPESLELLRDRVTALDEITALAEAGRDLASLGPELVAATNAAQSLIDAGLADGSLLSLPLVESRKLDALIEPEEQEGVSVAQIPDTGNLRVENDTSLYLSTRIDDIELERVLVGHVGSPFHPKVIGPQSAFWGIASSMDYDAPRGRDARVEVLTAGGAAPLPTQAISQRAHTLLALRTVTAGVIAPFLDVMLDIKVQPRVVVSSLIRYAPGEVFRFGAAVRAGDVEGATVALIDLLLTQANALAQTGEGGDLIVSILKDLAGDFLRNRASAFASRFIPIVGQLKLIYGAFDDLSNNIQGARSLIDIAGTPAMLEFMVLFGMAVTDLEPDEVPRGCTGGYVTVVGAGLHPQVEAGVTKLPQVTIVDPHVLGADPLTITEGHWRIAADGTQIEIALPDYFTSTMQGPLEVSVSHRGETATAPDSIEVSGDPTLTEVYPAVASEGELVFVLGSGLDEPIQVLFIDPTDESLRAVVSSFDSVSPTRLDLVVPPLPGASTRWLVQVQQGAGLCEVSSNSVSFSTSAADCITTIVADGGPRGINESGVVVGHSWSTGECWLLYPRDGHYFIDDDGDGENDLLVRISLPDLTCEAVGITADGRFAGTVRSNTTPGLDQGFIADIDGIRPFGTPGDLTEVRGINASGDMVGVAWFLVGAEMAKTAAAISSSGVLSPLTTPTTLEASAATSVADSGDAAGYECCRSSRMEAVAWPGGYLPDYGGGESAATALNALDQIAGYVYDTNVSSSRGVLWEDGTMIPLDNGLNARPIDINELGQIIGSSPDGGVLWLLTPAYGRAAGRVDLLPIATANDWVAPFRLPVAINDAGQIVGGHSPGWLMDMSACE